MGDLDRDQSEEGGVKGGGGDAMRPPLVLECGVAWVAINSVPNDGEGEGMRDIEVDGVLMGARSDGGSVKPRYIECAAQHRYTKGFGRLRAAIIVGLEAELTERHK